MKKSLLLVLLSFTLFICRAQIQKGELMLGGNIGFSTQNSNDDGVNINNKISQFNVGPSIAKAIKTNMVLGVGLNYNFSDEKMNINTPSYQQSRLNGGGVEVFLRNYKYLGKDFYVFWENDLNSSYAKSRVLPIGTGITETDEKQFDISLNFFPGFAYQVSKRWQFETTLPPFIYIEYNKETTTDNFSSGMSANSGGHGFSIGSRLSNQLTLNFGMRYLIGYK